MQFRAKLLLDSTNIQNMQNNMQNVQHAVPVSICTISTPHFADVDCLSSAKWPGSRRLRPRAFWAASKDVAQKGFRTPASPEKKLQERA